MAEARTALARFDEGGRAASGYSGGLARETRRRRWPAGLGGPATAHLPLAQFLARARERASAGLFRQLDRGSRLRAECAAPARAALLAVAAVALAAGCFGWERRDDRARAVQADELRRQGLAQAQQSADRRNALEHEIEALLRVELQTIAGAPPPHAEFSKALARAQFRRRSPCSRS